MAIRHVATVAIEGGTLQIECVQYKGFLKRTLTGVRCNFRCEDIPRGFRPLAVVLQYRHSGYQRNEIEILLQLLRETGVEVGESWQGGPLVRAKALAGGVMRRLVEEQDEKPLALFGDLSGADWLYRGEIYRANQLYTSEEVKLLVWEQKERHQRKFERLRKQMEAGGPTGEARRERIPEDVRTFVWRRDGGKCVRCGRTENLEFDHVIPISKGGSSTVKNVQLLCVECNRKKSDHI